MTDFEELRGRYFEWKYAGGYPLRIDLLEEEKSVGKVWKPTNNRPVCLADFTEIEWRIYLGENRYTVAFGSEGPPYVEAQRNLIGHVAATVDGIAQYDLVSPTPHDLVWRDANKAVVLRFHRQWNGGDTIPGGTFSFPDEIDPLHGPALLVLGIALIYEIQPFTTGTHAYFVD